MAPPSVPLRGPLRPARFLERPNRFLVRAEPEGAAGANGPVEAHLPDPGRLRELLLPGRRVWLRPAAGRLRRTRWTLVLVESPDGRGLVSLDTTLPNRLVRAALEAEALPELWGWRLERAEYPHGRSRLDFLLVREPAAALADGPLPAAEAPTTGGPDLPRERQAAEGRSRAPSRMAVEVKSVTLVEDGVALFPDAVTARGARHVEELAELARRPGWEAAILFVLQREDARRIEAARSIDPAFADALALAREAGVRVLGRRCTVSRERVVLGPAVPAA